MVDEHHALTPARHGIIIIYIILYYIYARYYYYIMLMVDEHHALTPARHVINDATCKMQHTTGSTRHAQHTYTPQRSAAHN